MASVVPASLSALRSPAKIPRDRAGRFRPGTKYRADMCDLVVAMMSEGASKAEVAAACGISRETLYAWCDPQHRHHRKAFAQAVTYGELLAEAWWQRLGRMAVLGAVPGFVPAAYIWQTKNRFGWRDRVDIGQDQPLQVAVVDYAAAPSAGETE